MIIGKVEFDLEELLCGPIPQPEFRSPFAHKDCGCKECKKIIMADAWLIWAENDHIEDEKQLAEAVAKFNWGDE
jgi:hypothetical protein